MRKAIIFCNNNYSDFVVDFTLDGFIIAADGGAEFLRSQNVIPDILIGDFDSTTEDTLQFFQSKAKQIRFPVMKDKTDSELAVDYCVEEGFDQIVMVNAVNGQLEHSLANIFLIEKYVQKGIKLYFINKTREIFTLHGKEEITLKSKPGSSYSLIPLSKKVYVEFIKGFQYPLEQKVLDRSSSRGVSNRALEREVSVNISAGTLLLIRER